jgi:biopolymer transport protein ExbB/TolQ
MDIDWQISGTVVVVLAAHLVAVVIFLTRAADRASRSELAVREVEKKLRHLEERIALEATALAYFREQVAREYVSREAMRELEERVVRAIDRVGDRLDRIIAPASG